MEKAYRILLVEDDPMISKTLIMSLPYNGFEVTARDSIQTGIETFTAKTFDAVLLDINLPDGNGLDLCQKIKKVNDNIPILIITAKTDEKTAVLSLEGGADDYIRKPYGIQELSARILRLLERKKKSNQKLLYGSVRIDLNRRIAWVKESQINLGKREFDILTLLIRKSGDAVTRNEILDTLGEDSDIYDRTIDSHLSHLRKKLKDAGSADVQIVSIYGIGYRLEQN